MIIEEIKHHPNTWPNEQFLIETQEASDWLTTIMWKERINQYFEKREEFRREVIYE